jgi:hypothetical protein
MAELLDRVEERAALRDASCWIHDLVAMDVAPPALDLVLRPQGELGGVHSRFHLV